MFNAVILVQNIKALYPNIPQLDNGVCHGLSVMYVNAVLCKQVELFEDVTSFESIQSLGTVYNRIGFFTDLSDLMFTFIEFISSDLMCLLPQMITS